MAGALNLASGREVDSCDRDDAWFALLVQVGEEHTFASFNDSQDHRAVLAAFDRAIAAEEAKQAEATCDVAPAAHEPGKREEVQIVTPRVRESVGCPVRVRVG